MIVDELNKIRLTQAEVRGHLRVLKSFRLTLEYLAKEIDLEKVLQLLLVELLTKNRISYTNRIFGRYKKLSYTRDMTDLDNWHWRRRLTEFIK